MHFKEIERLLKEKYRELPEYSDNMTDLGRFVFVRTYSRYLPELKRRETWKETVIRAVAYNIYLGKVIDMEECFELFELVYDLKVQLSGRILYTGGTQSVEDHPSSLYNCSGQILKSIDDYAEMMYLGMLGCGTAPRITKENIDNFPKFRNMEVDHQEYELTLPSARNEHTELRFVGDDVVILSIGDSKFGWIQALKIFLELHTSFMYRQIECIIINYDNIRKKGEAIKGFGGVSAGHEYIQTMFTKLSKLINNLENGELSTIDALDITNIVAQNIVSAGVRRSAVMCGFDGGDESIANSKQGIYTENGMNQELSHRVLSNNSMFFYEKPSKERIESMMETIKVSGEPAFYNAEQAIKRFSDFAITNGCGEILLPDSGFCNLTTVDMALMGDYTIENLKRAFEIVTRAGVRMADVDLEIESFDKNQKKHRLIGVGMTGLCDAEYINKVTREQRQELFKGLREIVHAEGERYAKELGINTPSNMTTIKPAGTASLLGGKSAGAHFSYAPHFIRRVRVSAFDPLTKELERVGFNLIPENGQENRDKEDVDTFVVEFAIKGETSRKSSEVPVKEHFELYLDLMNHFVDHNVSITISVGEDEWSELTELVNEHWDEMVGVSFLPKFDSFYPLLPYESITEEEYKARLEVEPEFSRIDLSRLNLEEEVEVSKDTECSTGSCPIR